MRNQKAIIVLSVLGIFLLSLLLFYDKFDLIKKNIILKRILPQKSELPPPQPTLPPLKDPELRLKVFLNPAEGYQFFYRASYQINPVENGDLDLMRSDKVLAVLSVVGSEDVVAKESSFKSSIEKRDLTYSNEKLNLPQGEGLMHIAKNKNKDVTEDVLIVFNNNSLKKSMIINVKNFQDWLNYPEDIFSLIKSFNVSK